MEAATMNAQTNEHDLVVNAIAKANAAQYSVLSNVEAPVNYVSQMFPDLILMDKATQKPVFIIEVKRNGNVAQCIQQWKSVQSIPATLYIIVPESELQSAKSVADVVGLSTRFGSYLIDSNQNVSVKYG